MITPPVVLQPLPSSQPNFRQEMGVGSLVRDVRLVPAEGRTKETFLQVHYVKDFQSGSSLSVVLACYQSIYATTRIPLIVIYAPSVLASGALPVYTTYYGRFPFNPTRMSEQTVTVAECPLGPSSRHAACPEGQFALVRAAWCVYAVGQAFQKSSYLSSLAGVCPCQWVVPPIHPDAVNPRDRNENRLGDWKYREIVSGDLAVMSVHSRTLTRCHVKAMMRLTILAGKKCYVHRPKCTCGDKRPVQPATRFLACCRSSAPLSSASSTTSTSSDQEPLLREEMLSEDLADLSLDQW